MATPPTDAPITRRRRANGVASREKILDAAAEVASERGYDGTTISLVCERCGLPASSIYWHFNSKDELIAAVIDRSFQTWVAKVGTTSDPSAGGSADEALGDSMRRTGEAIADAPDFLRVGLMLILERRPDEPSARKKFVAIRRLTHSHTAGLYATLFPDLDADAHGRLATLTVATADGILIAHEIDDIDVTAAFDLLAAAVLGAVTHLRARQGSPSGRDPSLRRRARATS